MISGNITQVDIDMNDSHNEMKTIMSKTRVCYANVISERYITMCMQGSTLYFSPSAN